eukprot:5309413-Prymnesium_polylepis.1
MRWTEACFGCFYTMHVSCLGRIRCPVWVVYMFFRARDAVFVGAAEARADCCTHTGHSWTAFDPLPAACVYRWYRALRRDAEGSVIVRNGTGLGDQITLSD